MSYEVQEVDRFEFMEHMRSTQSQIIFSHAEEGYIDESWEVSGKISGWVRYFDNGNVCYYIIVLEN